MLKSISQEMHKIRRFIPNALITLHMHAFLVHLLYIIFSILQAFIWRLNKSVFEFCGNYTIVWGFMFDHFHFIFMQRYLYKDSKVSFFLKHIGLAHDSMMSSELKIILLFLRISFILSWKLLNNLYLTNNIWITKTLDKRKYKGILRIHMFYMFENTKYCWTVIS